MSQVIVCPTITAADSREYKEQMDKVTTFAGRLHLDVADGQLAPRKLIDIDQLWWPGNVTVDLHVMYLRPFDYLDLFLVQHPEMVIIHAEADGDFLSFANRLHRHGIEVGVALLPQTSVDVIKPALREIDHVLIFSGNLGYQGGGRVDFKLLKKVLLLRSLKPTLEIGWDGGIDTHNAKDLIRAGVDVLNVGGYIQHSTNAVGAYTALEALI
jgi:ribulose-phosphate 3-epimerase